MDDGGQKGDHQGSKLVALTRFNSVRIGTRARDLEDLDVDLESSVYLLYRGLFVHFYRLFIWNWFQDGC